MFHFICENYEMCVLDALHFGLFVLVRPLFKQETHNNKGHTTYGTQQVVRKWLNNHYFYFRLFISGGIWTEFEPYLIVLSQYCARCTTKNLYIYFYSVFISFENCKSTGKKIDNVALSATCLCWRFSNILLSRMANKWCSCMCLYSGRSAT